MAMPAYKSVGAGGAAIATDACFGTWDAAPACPTTVDAGDILVLSVALNTFSGTVDSFNTPSGWTALKSVGVGGVSAAACFYKVASGSEDSATVTVSGTFTGFFGTGSAVVWSFSGSGSGGVSSAGSTSSGSGTSATMSAVTTTAANSLAGCFVISSYDPAVSTGETGGDWTEPVASVNSSPYYHSLQTANMASIGTITGGTSAIAFTSNWWTMSFEIKEVTAAAAFPFYKPPLLSHHIFR